MPSLNWIKIALYGGSALLVIGMLWTINGWRIDSNHYEAAVEQKEAAEKALADEKKCLVGTSCAALIANNANKAAQEVAKYKHDAEQANIDARNAKDQASKAEAEKNRAEVKQHQAELANIKLHQNTLSCEEQRKVKLLCSVD